MWWRFGGPAVIQGSGFRAFGYLRFLSLTVVALLAVLGTTTDADAQTDAPATTQEANLPDAPTPQVPAQQTDQGGKAQLKHSIEVLGKLATLGAVPIRRRTTQSFAEFARNIQEQFAKERS